MNAHAPRCLNCGKKLHKCSVTVYRKYGEPTPKVLGVIPVKQVLRIKPLPVGTLNADESLSVWLGDWGYKGCNKFCTLACAGDYAIQYTHIQVLARE